MGIINPNLHFEVGVIVQPGTRLLTDHSNGKILENHSFKLYLSIFDNLDLVSFLDFQNL